MNYRSECVLNFLFRPLRDWSLITGSGAKKREAGGGGATKWEGGGACEVVPLQKDGAEKISAMLKG